MGLVETILPQSNITTSSPHHVEPIVTHLVSKPIHVTEETASLKRRDNLLAAYAHLIPENNSPHFYSSELPSFVDTFMKLTGANGTRTQSPSHPNIYYETEASSPVTDPHSGLRYTVGLSSKGDQTTREYSPSIAVYHPEEGFRETLSMGDQMFLDETGAPYVAKLPVVHIDAGIATGDVYSVLLGETVETDVSTTRLLDPLKVQGACQQVMDAWYGMTTAAA